MPSLPAGAIPPRDWTDRQETYARYRENRARIEGEQLTVGELRSQRLLSCFVGLVAGLMFAIAAAATAAAIFLAAT